MRFQNGRKSGFTQEIADTICERMMAGESLRKICKGNDMPTTMGVLKWLRRYPDFAMQYAYAAQERSDALVEEILDIADDGTNDWMESNDPDNPGFKMNGEHIARSRLRVDTRKWIAGKMKPKKYGDLLRLAGGLTMRRAEELTDDELALIAASGSNAPAQEEDGPTDDE